VHIWKHPGSPSNYNELLRVKNTEPPINALFANCINPQAWALEGETRFLKCQQKKLLSYFRVGKTNFTFAPVGKRWAKSTNDYPLNKVFPMTMKTVIGKAQGNFGFNWQTDRIQSMTSKNVDFLIVTDKQQTCTFFGDGRPKPELCFLSGRLR